MTADSASMKLALGRNLRFTRLWSKAASRVGDSLILGSLIAVAILLASGFAFWLVEKESNPEVTGWFSGLEWLMLTLLQQASPWEVTTGTGEVLLYVVLIVGVSLVAMATGAIASKLVEYVLRKGSGMGRAKTEDHIVICGWSSKGAEILRELHAEEVEDKRPVVILAQLGSSPTKDALCTFISGDPANGDDLLRAGIDRAETAIILADHSVPAMSAGDRDAKTLLTTLAVESINPDCYTCVEVIRSENRDHFRRTRADELVVSAELTGALLASSAVHHGLSGLVTDLITHPQGNEFYSMSAPHDLDGMRFEDALLELKRTRQAVLVAVARDDGSYQLNPPGDQVISRGERLLVIASRETDLETDPAAAAT